jgi:putative membrane protein
MIRLAVLALAALMTLAAEPASARVVRAATAHRLAPITVTEFVKQAARFDAYELKAGGMAPSSSRNREIRAFARRMVSAHQKNATALDAVLKRMHSGLKTSMFVIGAHGNQIHELEAVAGADFDETYKAQQIDNHRAAVRLYADYAARGRNRRLRAFASAALPILQRHLALSEKLLSGR